MTFSRIASLVVAAAYLFTAAFVVGGDAQRLVPCVAAAVLPLPFIWFPDALGDYTGPADIGYINRPTPGLMVAVAAWVILAVVPPILITVYA
ncbi:MAG TPA: hypothetical protein VKE40_25730 [Gemmataceae bacterium]|nr:hypothetical protein [Gemmataceae bacterium]